MKKNLIVSTELGQDPKAEKSTNNYVTTLKGAYFESKLKISVSYKNYIHSL